MSKGNYQLFKKNNVCPVCDGHNGCKEEIATERILCRGIPSTNAYKRIATSGQWGIYLEASKVVNPKNFTEADRAAYYAAQEAHRYRAREQAKIEHSKLIPVTQRTEEIASLLSELELYSKHVGNLTSRKLGTSDITLGAFRSIRKYQKFSRTYDLPGFVGNKYVGETGLLCPAKDAQGRWVGFQIMSDNSDHGKYKWTAHNVGGVSVSARLREYNEFPMNVVHKATSAFIGVCEGILKPFVASQRHGISLIGYAGGQFSPKYLLSQLRLLNPQKKLPVVVFPDKGTIINTGWVFQLNQQYIEVLVSNGYQVKVADWGHWASKDLRLDIDEIDNLDKLQLRDVEYFEACRDNLVLYVEAIDFGLDKEASLRIIPDFITSLINAPKLVARAPRGKLKLTDHGEFEPLPRTGLPEFIGKAGSYEFTCNSSDVYREAIDLGYKVVLDISGTGTGKTTSATLLELEEKERLFYLTTESRNPNHEKLETDFRELPARNQGYVYDSEKATPSGRPQRRIPREGEVPSTVGNCHWNDKFIALRNCNSTVNPCNLCTREYYCMSSSGDGHGYKYQTKHALGSDRIIANPQGISDTMLRKGDIGIVDEYSQSVEWLKKIEVKLDDIADLKQRFINDNQHTDQYKLIPLLNAVANLLTDDVKKWGLSTAEILEKLTVIPQEEIAEIKPIIQEIVSGYNKQVILSNKKEGRYGLEVLFVKEWVFLLLDILSGELKHSSLSLANNTLSIVVKNQRTIDNLLKFKTVIFQDATGSKQDLGLRLGIQPHEILVIRKKDPVPLNLLVHHVVGCGRLGNQRRLKAQNTVAILRGVFDNRHGQGNVGYIDYKGYAQPGDLHHHSDARGSNLFANKAAVVSFGVPCANLGAVQTEYEALTGDRVCLGDEKLQFFINSKVIAEVVQEIGRIRANRRVNTQLHYYFCGDINTDFLKELGFNVAQESAINLDIKAGNTQQIARYNLISAFQKTIEIGNNFRDITQQKLAEQAKLAQNSISYMGNAFGGWEQLKRVLSSLLCENKEQFSSEFGALTEDDIYLANNYLPEIFKLDFEAMCDELHGIIRAYGEAKLHQLLDTAPVESLIEFLHSIYNHLPFYYQKRFLVLCKDYVGSS